MSLAEPVSASLEAQLDRELSSRGLVVWTDPPGLFSPLADALAARHEAGSFPHPVLVFRGSWLEWLVALGERPAGLDATPLLVYLPRLTDAQLRETPALPLLELSAPFETTLERALRDAAAGRARPDRIERAASDPALTATLAAADAWLAGELDVLDADRAALYAKVSTDTLLDDLLARTNRHEPKLPSLRFDTPADVDALAAHLHVALGMGPAWVSFCDRSRPRAAHDDAPGRLARLVLDLQSWVLCVEYASDLRREPHLAQLAPLRALPELLSQRCRALAVHLRTHHAAQYPSLADEVEGTILEGEFKNTDAHTLGRIDTFRREEELLLDHAVGALKGSRFTEALAHAEDRLGADAARSFWLSQFDEWSQSRRWMWTLAREAALLGAAIQASPPRGAFKSEGIEEAAERYAQHFALVDQRHRHFEQRLAALLDPRMEHYGALQEISQSLREAYRAWADELARGFTERCRERGFLPEPGYQQRTLYEQVVQPLLDRGARVAVFLVDALRYEMAEELQRLLAGEGRTLALKPRLAELPTVTAVGMNALPPVARNGRLEVVREFEGFRSGEFAVTRPEDRARAVGQFSLGKPKALLLDLAAVCSPAPGKDLAKQVAQSRVVVVQSREIDDAGEANFGIRTFDGTLRDLVAAWHLLHAAGVEACVITADHGFLLQDATTQVHAYGTKRDPRRRYVFDPLPRAENGLAYVALSKLGYDGLEGYLHFREDTGVFATGVSGASFVHGGNSLQERVVPVLVVEAARARGKAERELRVVAEAMPPLLGFNRVRVRVVRADDGPARRLALEAEAPVDVSPHVPGRADVRVVVRDVSGAGTLVGGRVHVPVGGDWTECFFALEGPEDDRVRVEFFHPNNPRRVEPSSPEALFVVEGLRRPPEPAAAKKSSPPPSPRESTGSMKAVSPAAAAATAATPAPKNDPAPWLALLPEEPKGVRAIFGHLSAHGVVTETEATKMLGSARHFRAFSLEFERHADKVPFKIRIETGADGKRYVRERDK